jgi:hypothetical protein
MFAVGAGRRSDGVKAFLVATLGGAALVVIEPDRSALLLGQSGASC